MISTSYPWTLVKLQSFVEELAYLLEAGLPLMGALQLIQSTPHQKRKKALASQLLARLSQGQLLAVAWKESTQEPISSAMLLATEKHGLLSDTLKHVSHYARQDQLFRQLFWQAVRYPLFLLVVTYGMVLGLCHFVIPSFSDLYLNINTNLPWISEIILRSSPYIQSGGLILGILVVVLSGFFWVSTQYKKMSYWEAFFPWFSQHIALIRDYYELRFWHTFVLILQEDVSLIKALSLCRSLYHRPSAIDAVIQAMQQGSTLTQAVQSEMPRLSPSLLSILRLGENSGTLVHLLKNFTQAWQAQWQIRVESMKVWLEPLFLCIIGGLIGIVLIGLYLPMIELGQHI